MQKSILFFSLFILSTHLKASDKQWIKDVSFENMQWVNAVGAKQFPGSSKTVYVNDYGAKGDGTTMNTSFIQKAINECASKGGGIVSFKKGNYLTGSIYLKQGVHLLIDHDVVILGSQQIEDYPEIKTRVAGIEMVWPLALINAIDGENIAITGKGLIKAQGKPFWDLYWRMRKEDYEPKGLRWIVDYDCKRPRTLLIQNCKNITISDITIMQSGFWAVHLLYSSQVTVDGIIIRNNIDGHGPSTDGIDIDSSEKILIQHCDIDCNDDNFCIKSGRDADGLRVNKPTRYVVIVNCVSRRGAGLVTLGSETSGGISHILGINLTAIGTSAGIKMKSAKTRGGNIEYIYFQNIKLDSIGTALSVSLNWNPSYSYSSLPEGYELANVPEHWKTMLQTVEPPEKGIPQFSKIFIKNVSATHVEKGIDASGFSNSLLRDFFMENVDINCLTSGKIENASGWKFKDVQIHSQDKEELLLENCHSMQIK